MTLLSPGVVWSWPSVDPIIDLSDFVFHEWEHVGDSHVWKVLESDLATIPLWYCKVGKDALAERLTYLIAREIDLPCQHVFWGIRGDSPLAVIRPIPHACSMQELQHDADSHPYVTYHDQAIPIVNERDRIGFHALQLLFDDLDGGECLIDADSGLMVRIDGASGYSWVTQALIPTAEVDIQDAKGLLQQVKSLVQSLNWPGDDELLEGLQAHIDQTMSILRSGPNVDYAIRTINEAEFIPEEHRAVMIQTLKALANCNDLPRKVSDGLRNAPSPTVRRLADDAEIGLTKMCRSLAEQLPTGE